MSLVSCGLLDDETEMEMEGWFGSGWRSDYLAMEWAMGELGTSSCLREGDVAVHDSGYPFDVGSGRRTIKIEINCIFVLWLG